MASKSKEYYDKNPKAKAKKLKYDKEYQKSKREVDRHELFRSMKSYEVKEIIERLKNAGEIQEIEIKVGGKGRPTKRFVAVDPNFFEE